MAEPAAVEVFPSGARLNWRYPERMNAAAVLVDEAARRYASECAILFGDRRITYQELRSRVDRFAQALLAAGLCAGERFVCCLRNTPETAVALLAGIKIGAVPVPTFHSVTDEELARVIDVSGAVALVDHERSAARPAPALRFTVRITEDGVVDDDFARLLAQAAPSLEPAPTRRDTIAMLCFSSGTTGLPKGLPHTHQNIIAVADSAVPVGLGGLGPGDVTLSTSPFGFAYGLAAMVFYPLRYGATVVYSARRMDAALACELIQRHSVTHFLTVPTLCAQVLQGCDPSVRLPSLRVVKVGGMAASEDLQRQWWERFGIEMLPAFGMQELIGSAISCSPSHFERGTLGLPQPGCEARVLREDGSESPDGEPGRLCLKTPFTIPHYWRDERHSAEVLGPDGWLLTDDFVTRAANGFFRYVGRADRTIISAGWSISPAEVEAVLAEHPFVREAVVVGVEDPDRGAIPVAAVVLRSAGTTLAGQALAEHLRSRLAAYKCPREVRFFEALPRTHSGKVSLAAVRLAFERTQVANSD